jgi:hypothetical protein
VLTCQLLTHVLQDEKCKIVDLCCRFAGCDLRQLLSYDVVEYGVCEHRRLLCRTKRRGKRKCLLPSFFLKSHYAALKQQRKAVIQHILKKYALV